MLIGSEVNNPVNQPCRAKGESEFAEAVLLHLPGQKLPVLQGRFRRRQAGEATVSIPFSSIYQECGS